MKCGVYVYVDDMIVKSVVIRNHMDDLKKWFQTVRDHNLCLNLIKCTFGLSSDKFLIYLVSKRAIEVNPEKIKAILDMKSSHRCATVDKGSRSTCPFRC